MDSSDCSSVTRALDVVELGYTLGNTSTQINHAATA